MPPLVLVGSLDHLPEEQRGFAPACTRSAGLDDAELHALYRQAERLWQPSYAEGFGLPVVEALSVGTPAAVASGTSLDEVTPPSAPRFAQRRRRPGTPDAAWPMRRAKPRRKNSSPGPRASTAKPTGNGWPH